MIEVSDVSQSEGPICRTSRYRDDARGSYDRIIEFRRH